VADKRKLVSETTSIIPNPNPGLVLLVVTRTVEDDTVEIDELPIVAWEVTVSTFDDGAVFHHSTPLTPYDNEGVESPAVLDKVTGWVHGFGGSWPSKESYSAAHKS